MATIIPLPFGVRASSELDASFSGSLSDVEPLQTVEGNGPFAQACRLAANNDPKAAMRFRQAVLEGDRPADAWCALGILELREGKKRGALTCYNRALKEVPRHALTHRQLGNLYYDLGEYNKARVHFHIASEIEPDVPAVHWSLAQLHMLHKAYGAAMNALVRYRSVADEEGQKRANALLARLRKTVAMDGT
jgi:tetratricopeptide (TPR) repeat protein